MLISTKADYWRPSYSDSNNSRWPPSAILDYGGSVFRPFCMLWVPIFNADTKFCEDTLINDGGMPQKRNPKKRPLVAEFYFLLQRRYPQSYVSSCKISAKSADRFQTYITFAILPFGATHPILLCCGIRTPCVIECPVGPQECSPETASWSVAFFAQWSLVDPCDRQTDGHTPHTSVTIGCISCIGCSLKIRKKNSQITQSKAKTT